MTRDAGFNAEETGQRYTEAPTDLEGLEARMFHQPVPERLLAHLRNRYGIDGVAATQVSVHRADVFRIDRVDGDPWIARAFPPARPRAGAEGDATILRFLARQDYPAERLAVDDAVSDFEGSSVLVTEFIHGERIPPFTDNMTVMADLLGRLHALPLDDTVTRPGGAQGVDPSREGSPRQDLLAALHSSTRSTPRCHQKPATSSNSSATRCDQPTTATGYRRRCCTATFPTPPITSCALNMARSRSTGGLPDVDHAWRTSHG